MTNYNGPPNGAGSSKNLVTIFILWTRTFGREFYVALFLGWIGEFLFAMSSNDDPSVKFSRFWTLWFSGAGTFFIGTIIGFLFGLPKAKESINKATGGIAFGDNTNLEEVSDWLTKIVVGVSLIEAQQLMAAINNFSVYISKSFPPNSGAYPVAVSVLLWGFACGFMNYYSWARFEFKRNLDIRPDNTSDASPKDTIHQPASLSPSPDVPGGSNSESGSINL